MTGKIAAALNLGLLVIFMASPLELFGGEVDVSGFWSRPMKVTDGAGTGGYDKVSVDPSGLGSHSGLSVFGYETLYPESCGACHADQLADWSNSHHSMTVRPGLIGQLDTTTNPGFAESCNFCHAPAIEQSDVKAVAGGGYVENVLYDERLNKAGVTCVVCHMRDSVIYGPEPFSKAERVRASASDSEPDAHEFQVREFFESSEFCASCHQLDIGYVLNGTVLTNTYREWKESVFGENNVTCQNCHMPGRRHLFRGIHDPEMVRSGVKLEVEKTAPADGKQGTRVVLRLKSVAVGHYFPSYVTPLVEIKGFLIGPDGTMSEGTLKKAYVGRQVSLDLTRELFDTRIPPLGVFEFEYTVEDPGGYDKLILEVWVFPDDFYDGFFRNGLEKRFSFMDLDVIEKAVEITGNSEYLLYREEVSLGD